MTRKQWLIGGVILLVLIVAVGAWYVFAKPKTPAPTDFPIAQGDTISSWTFKGAYSGNDTLIAQAHTDMTTLKSYMGKGQYDDYDLWNGIGNDDASLGDGKAAYDAYDRAIAIHPERGLAYDNLAHLMTLLGAYNTAKAAYAQAVTAEPSMLEYHLDRLTFLTTDLPKDNTDILAAFTDAAKQFGDSPQTLMIEAQWLASVGRYADAITAWKQVETLTPGADHTAISAEIKRLQAKV